MNYLKLARKLTGVPLALAWGAAVSVGMAGLVRYQMTPGATGQQTPRVWPAGVKDIALKPDGLTLVMTLHPQCPCSGASLDELTELMSRSEGKISGHILFVKPTGAPAGWCDGDLWEQAKKVPGVNVSIDQDGKDAAIFGATTSGQVMVYDSSGTIRFSGGITAGRGHEGDNAGLSAVLTLVRGGKAVALSTTPVYGCSLGVCQLKSQDGRSGS